MKDRYLWWVGIVVLMGVSVFDAADMRAAKNGSVTSVGTIKEIGRAHV